MSNRKYEETAVERIRLVMATKKVNIRGLSEMTGLQYRTLQNSLSARHGLKAEALARICEALDVSADFIVFGLAARLDLEDVEDTINQLNDLNILSGNKLESKELAKIFNNIYQTEYTRDFRIALSPAMQRFVNAGEDPD